MEKLLEKQTELQAEIERSYSNYKKDSKSRKTVKYLTEKLTILDQTWEDFSLNHERIKKSPGGLLTSYYKSKVAHTLYVKHIDFRNAIIKARQELIGSATSSASEANAATPPPVNGAAASASEAKNRATPPPVKSAAASATQHNTATPPPVKGAAASASVNTGEQKHFAESAAQTENVSNTTSADAMTATEPTKAALLQKLERRYANYEVTAATLREKCAASEEISVIKAYWNELKEQKETVEATVDKLMELDFSNEMNAKYMEFNQKHREVFSLVDRHIKADDNGSELKLPAIRIPDFNGEFTQWISFYDTFEKAIHENNKLGDAQKLSYLKSHLEGEAAAMIEHLHISNGNYTTALNLLKERYHNKRVIVSQYIQMLFTLPKLHAENAQGLRKIHDTTMECLHGLQNIGTSTDGWDPMLLHILSRKLDDTTLNEYERDLKNKKEIPKLQEFLQFIEQKFISLQTAAKTSDVKKQPPRQAFHSGEDAHPRYKCLICNTEGHTIQRCRKFAALSPTERSKRAREKSICFNCLSSAHRYDNCTSKPNCGECGGKHHSLLHFKERFDKNNRGEGKVNQATIANKQSTEVLLATALVNCHAANGASVTLRALIDSGAQSTFITENATQQLQLKKSKNNTNINGFGETSAGKTSGEVNLTFTTLDNELIGATALVFNKFTQYLPSHKISKQGWKHIQNLQLADPTFDRPGKVDLIIGADAMPDIMLPGFLSGPNGTPMAQETKLGWILSGRTNQPQRSTHCFIGIISTDEILNKLWEIEEISEDRPATSEDINCEELYQKTVSHAADGKYIVPLPLKEEVTLGRSRSIAIARLFQLEKQFDKNPELRKKYSACIREYIAMGHMEEASTTEEEMCTMRNNVEICNTAYLPHQAVIKQDSTTTKLRVVFDASRKTKNGNSLNDALIVGPTIQQDIFSILARWRFHKIAFTADVEKMYRQIWVDDKGADLQRIVWRETPQEKIKDYRLKTVTFGTASAPFIAIRTLHQIAIEHQETFPDAAAIIKRDFYVDDLISGCDSLEEAITSRRQLTEMLAEGGFPLRKWTTNSVELFNTIPPDYREEKASLEIDHGDNIKALGIYWQNHNDCFTYEIKQKISRNAGTKREFLSQSGSKDHVKFALKLNIDRLRSGVKTF